MMEDTRYDEMAEAARKFHNKHPEVWVLFQQFALERIARGFKHYSVNGIFERIRWETGSGGDGITTFKISNNHRPFYARAFMKKYPEHEGFFRTSVQKSKEKKATGLPEITPLDIGDRNGNAI